MVDENFASKQMLVSLATDGISLLVPRTAPDRCFLAHALQFACNAMFSSFAT